MKLKTNGKGLHLYFYLGFIVLVNIILLFIPLTNIFGYEFSAINALILFFMSGIYTINLFKGYSSAESLLPLLKKLTAALMLFAAIPLVISCANSIFGTGCSFTDGFLFYGFITLPSILAGSSTGLFVLSLLNKYRRPVFLAVYFLLFMIPLAEFYFNPQVYFFTVLVGYFPGIIYDEGLSINQQIVIYRFLNVLFFTGIFLTSLYLLGKKKSARIIAASVIILISVIFISFSSFFGFSTTKGRLSAELDKKIETEHFTIHFSKKIDDNFVRLITLQHEYYYSELSEFFQSAPYEKITSFVFNDRFEKKQLMGSENADVAKPWLYQIFTSYENYNSSLKHELAHIFTADFGKGLLKVADDFNPSLIEGIAMAADPVYAENALDYMAALAYNNGYKTNLSNLYDHFNFFKQTSSLSYIYAGSFTKFLIDNYGIEKFKKLYTTLDFQKIYRISFEEITEHYFKYLKTVEDSYNVHAANYYFGKKSIFFKVCPRHVSDQIDIAWQKYNSKNYIESRDIFRQSYELSDDYSALYGYVNSLSKLKERTAAIEILQQEIYKYEGTSSYYNLELRLADLYAEEGDIVKADSIYLEIIKQNPARNFYYVASTRMYLARENSVLKMYLNGSDFTKYYLLKRMYYKRNNYNFLPIMIDLSRNLEEDYRLFISQFGNHFSDGTYESSYAFYKLSNYMLENLDFSNARKMAVLALRFREDRNFTYLLERNHFKIMWLQNNQETLLTAIQDQM